MGAGHSYNPLLKKKILKKIITLSEGGPEEVAEEGQ